MAIPALGTVLCAVDESDTSAAVIYTAAGLAAHPTSKLVILQVKDRLDSDEARTAAKNDLRDLAYRATPGWAAYRETTELAVAAGPPAETILAEAANRGANLIVIGTHRHGRLAQAIFGSVTTHVLRHARVPVAVVPPESMEVIALTNDGPVPHFGTILVPVRLDGGSARQLALASTLSMASNHPINLLHAIPEHADSAEPLARIQELSRALDSHTGVRAIVTHGSLVNVIDDRQQREHAGIVILGRDDSSPGHVARALLQQTHAVVVFVP